MTDKPEERLFATVPLKILDSPELSCNEMILLIRITGLTRKEGYCYAGNTYLAELMKVSVATIKRRLKKLHECDFIKCTYQSSSYGKKRIIYINPAKCLISQKFYDKDQSKLNPPQLGNELNPQHTNELYNKDSIFNKDNNKYMSQTNLRPTLTQDEENKDSFIDTSLDDILLDYKEAVKAICEANNDPLPKKYADKKRAMKAWTKLIPDDKILNTVRNHLSRVQLSARRQSRLAEWKRWQEFFEHSEGWAGGEGMEDSFRKRVFVPNLKRLDRYLEEWDWENVYLKLSDTFWGKVTENQIKPTQKALDKAGIKMQLIKDLDYDLVSVEEYKRVVDEAR